MRASIPAIMTDRIEVGSSRSKSVIVDGVERRDLRGKTTAEILAVFRAKTATPAGRARAKIRADFKRRGLTV